ncbi:hypothetical protein C1645_829045 [Glomus cerebriforme]|uniref:Uncharacterized protein n=1 Tax=Glomus cerebriforme TaxID=658196 RepID=A0A397SV18_9GLOM|nr:hypothetical protein C1645_829045 [Glomus cerebriforme]
MSNVYTLKDIKDREHQLEQEEDIGNKISQLNASSVKVRSQLISEQKSHSKSQRELEVVELESKLEDLKQDPVFHNSNVVGGVIEEPAQINSFESKEIDSLRLELERENSRLRELVSKKDNKVDPSSPPMNDSSQKLPDWLSDNLRSLVYKHSLEDKVIEFDKSFVKKHILEALQELLLQDEMVLRNQAVTLPNQSIHSRPAYSEKSILREEIVKQSGSAKMVLSSQAIPLAQVIPIVMDSLMLPILIYFILKSRNINHARNLFDRAVTLLPRVDQFW